MKQKRGWWSIDSMDDYSDSIILLVFSHKNKLINLEYDKFKKKKKKNADIFYVK